MNHDEDRNKQPGDRPPANDEARGADATDSTLHQEALLALRQMAPPKAAAAVRDKARRAFMQGTQGQQAATASPLRPVCASFAVIRRRQRRSDRIIAFALAASLLFMLFGYGAQAPHRWQLTSVVDPDNDLRGRTDRYVGDFLAAGILETPEHGEFELTLGTALRLRMAPCSGIVLPQAPRRWNPDTVTITVDHGELFGSTGGHDLPAEVHLVTDELTALITGTTFAVFRIPEASCVCLLEGHIRITPKVGDQRPIDVPAGSKCLIYKDGRPAEIVPIDARERMKLEMILDRATAQ